MTILNRGITGKVEEGKNVRHIKSDRSTDTAFKKIKGAEYETCIDISGYNKMDVEKSTREIKTEYYIFISTTFVYDSSTQEIKKTSSIKKKNQSIYVRNKIEAENKLIENRDKSNSLIIRPSMLTGAGDHTERMALAL